MKSLCQVELGKEDFGYLLRIDHLLREKHRSILLLGILLILCSRGLAQVETATLSGVVTDQSGAVIVGAEVQVTNADTNITSRSTTNSSGIYVVTGLKPGRYRIHVAKDGFKGINLTDLTLNVQDSVSRNFALQIGSAAESITVDGSALIMNTQSAAVSTVVDQAYVKNMPLNGRSFQDLILLTPGVVTNNPETPTFGTRGEFSVGGQRTESNYYTVDGVSANTGIVQGDPTTAASSGSLPAATALGTTQTLLSLDAMEEFRVQTSTYSAEYGRNPGGQFSFVTRSGTNQWHGTAYDYLRNDVFDAKDWFNDYLNQPKPPLRQNDFGGTLGGPVKVPRVYNGVDKTFFFFSYEGLRLLAPQAASIAVVPNASLRASTPAPLQQVLQAFPVPNSTDLGNGFAQFVSSWSNPSNIDSTSVRLDHAVSERVRLFFRFSNTSSATNVRNIGGPAQHVSIEAGSRTYTFGAAASLSSHLADDFRLNYSSTDVGQSDFVDSFGGATPTDLFALQPGISGPHPTSQVSIAFFVGASFSGITAANIPSQQRQWNVVDTLAYTLGRHQLKFGIDYRRLTPRLIPPAPDLLYLYFSPSDVQANNVGFGDASNALPAFPIYSNFSTFGLDDWKLAPRLTLSMGLRWEVNPPPGARSGNLPYTVLGANPATMTLAPQGTKLWQTTWYNLAPRLGVAYVLRGNLGWETVVRGGGGVFFDTGQQLGSQGYGGAGFTAVNSFGPASFPVPANQADPLIVNPPQAPYSPAVFTFEPHLQLPFTLHWNANLQQALGKSQSLTVTYVGANGRRLLQSKEQYVAPLNTNFGVVVFTGNGLTSDYNALETQYQRRLSRGLQALASYTWSHSIDYGSQNGELPYLRGNSDFDVRHSLSAALSYDLPTVSGSPFAGALLNHWGIDDRFTARTGFPVTLNGNNVLDPATLQFFHDGLNLTGAPLYIYGSACTALYNNGKGCPGGRAINPAAFSLPAGCDPFSCPPGAPPGDAPRNLVRGFGAWQMDTAVRREFPISERLKLQFRAEAFNLFNHPNFGQIIGPINPNYCNPASTPGCTFGQAINTLAQGLGGLNPLYQMGGPRSMQFALKLMF